MRILVLHGPNLNLLGKREPEIYGSSTLLQINLAIRRHAHTLGCRLRIHQSNHEGVLLDLIHRQRRWAQGILINPGALTHSSYSLRDGIRAVGLPTVEVHLSDLRQRALVAGEEFRALSLIAPVCCKQVMGLGLRSYLEGLTHLVRTIKAVKHPEVQSQRADLERGT